MPSLARKIIIAAAVDGLILSPVNHSRPNSPPSNSSAGAVRVDFKSQKISQHSFSEKPTEGPLGLEVHGIVGLLKLSPSRGFLIAITGREQVANIRGRHPVYVITDVALIPLSSRKEAQEVIDRTRAAQKAPTASEYTSDTEAEEPDDENSRDEEINDEVSGGISGRPSIASSRRRMSSAGQDVIGKKGAYGRFAERWFSKRGWAVDRRRAEGMSAEALPEPEPEATLEDVQASDGDENKNPETTTEQSATNTSCQGIDVKADEPLGVKNTEEVAELAQGDVAHSLTPKLLQTTRLLLARSRGFYFSYDWDITRSLATQENVTSSNLPLFKIVDPMFFWNRHLQQDLIDSGQAHIVMPVMQGFVRQRTFSATATLPTSVEEPNEPERESSDTSEPKSEQKDLSITLISRRSIHRAGLRYLRRGVDSNGNTANTVETEQILATGSWDHVFSYVQIRGSIPVYFQQSPYSLKPRPVLLHSKEINSAATNLHFKGLKERYGDVQIANLVEKNTVESVVGNKYRDAVAELNENEGSGVEWNWFDFHSECRGMRFENVSRLFTQIGEALDKFAYTEEVDADGEGVRKRQSGVLRTNCMDCLDRTNVVQSAAGLRALKEQLKKLGIDMKDERTEWFDQLWADNGDAISKQYASTSALKGDFTRTRKRTFVGALSDFGFTMTRYFNNIISDFFTQAAIDFLLGNVTTQVFTDFEAEMASSDPSVSMRRIRQNAIEIAVKIVVADENEELLGGWSFLAPREENTLRTAPLTEKILLLTDKALYACAFDFTLEKVVAFERVALEDAVELQWGAYITSTHTNAQTDERRNVGFIIRYKPNREDVIRVNTRSLTSKRNPPPSPETKFWAFKTLPADASAIEGDEHQQVSERDAVEMVVNEIQHACERFGKGLGKVKEEDVIGVQEAKKSTGLLEQWGYELKRLVWA